MAGGFFTGGALEMLIGLFVLVVLIGANVGCCYLNEYLCAFCTGINIIIFGVIFILVETVTAGYIPLFSSSVKAFREYKDKKENNDDNDNNDDNSRILAESIPGGSKKRKRSIRRKKNSRRKINSLRKLLKLKLNK